ncbi:MAG: GreA/GreB family elongation factor, partial [Rhodanobacteraceae bacterium]
RHRRPRVAAALAAAAAEGDRSENAEYTWRKKQLAEIDRRVRYLSKRLGEVRVVDTQPHDRSRIYFGAWFELEDEDGHRLRYRIVGPDETDAPMGWISVDSPLARAALGRSLGEEFAADLPDEEVRYAVVAVNYDGPIEDTESTR